MTPSQTVGPFFGPAMLRDERVAIDGPGEQIRVEGRVFDGEDQPVPDALLEVWVSDCYGEYHATDRFVGFARVGTDDAGRFAFNLPRPGARENEAPHVNLTIFARGLLNHLNTRIYFADDARLQLDPIFALVPEPRRHTLLAKREAGAFGAYKFDVFLQGPPTVETVFFRWPSS